MAALEGGIAALSVASGHAAQFMALINIAGPGDNIVASSYLYGGSYNQFKVFLKKFGIHAKFVSSLDPADFAAAIDENTKAVYVESIGNPKYIVADLPALAKIAHNNAIPLVVDNTFGMGGYLVRPIDHGADIVGESSLLVDVVQAVRSQVLDASIWASNQLADRRNYHKRILTLFSSQRDEVDWWARNDHWWCHNRLW